MKLGQSRPFNPATHMKTVYPVSLPQVSAGCFAVSDELAAVLFTPAELASLKAELSVKSSPGPWSQPISAKGLVVSFDYEADKANNYSGPRQPLLVYGRRTMSQWKQTGYEAEGRASVAGQSRRVFTSSKLFQLEDGRLLSAAVLHIGRG